MFQHGARIGFSRGDIRYLTDDLQILRPTIFPTVPRLLNRIYDKVSDVCYLTEVPPSSYSAMSSQQDVWVNILPSSSDIYSTSIR